MIREALKILAALLENCASAINERLDPPLPMVSREAIEEIERQRGGIFTFRPRIDLSTIKLAHPANDETITRH